MEIGITRCRNWVLEIKEIELPVERNYVKSSWHLYYIRLKNFLKRKIVFEKLQKLGIGTQVHYIPIHLQPYYRKNLGYKKGNYPNAERYYNATITIPLFFGLKKNKIKNIIQKIKKVFSYV
jgi:dTDP-4-amino-4,6-dideoxygalactose transaminase